MKSNSNDKKSFAAKIMGLKDIEISNYWQFEKKFKTDPVGTVDKLNSLFISGVVCYNFIVKKAICEFE